MKSTWIIILIVILNVIKLNSAQNDDTLESKSEIASDRLIERTNRTKTHTERHRKENVLNKRKKFVVTRRPPINSHHITYRRLKKRPLTKMQRRIISAHAKPQKSHKSRRLRVHTRKHFDETNKDRYMTNFFQKIIDNKNIAIAKENMKVICTDSQIKSILDPIKTMTNQEKDDLKQALLKAHECYILYNKLEKALSNKKYDTKLDGTAKKLNKSSDNEGSSKHVDSSEIKFNENKSNFIDELKNKTNTFYTDTTVPTEKLIDNSRSKRSVNIIEEEGSATTSSGFKFTGRDLAMHSGFMYKNIHN